MAAAGLTRATRFLNHRVPLIVVCGATGTGKSKLALEIAERYGGEVISADSMQIYQGLDIITNKVTADERRLVPHHLIDCASPLTRWTVVDFQRRSLPVIDRLLDQGKVPVIVGGTHYYIEALLWKVLLDDDPSTDGHSDLVVEQDGRRRTDDAAIDEMANDDELLKTLTFQQDRVEDLTSPRLHGLLKKVDPAMADTIHPNNRRKIIRSLQAWQQHGRPHSELLRSQRDSEGGSTLGGPLRYAAPTLIFWVQCQQEVLDRRLDARVDDMMTRGLVTELADFHRHYNAQRLADEKEADYTTGIFQSIGLKEFHDYLVLPSSEQTSDTGQKLLKQGVEALKVRTRRYARQQLKWIRKRFLQQPDRQVPPVYGLDATDVTEWNGKVRDLAFRIVDSFGSDGEAGAMEAGLKPLAVAETSSREEQTSFHCPLCHKVTVGQRSWQEHLKSNRHRKLVKRAANAVDGPDPKRRQGDEEQQHVVLENQQPSSPDPDLLQEQPKEQHKRLLQNNELLHR